MKISPGFTKFTSMARRGNVLPVSCTFPAGGDIPARLYRKIRHKRFSFLLESGTRSYDCDERGRYSFTGYEPLLTAILRDGSMEIREKDREPATSRVHDPLGHLRTLMKAFKAVKSEKAFPFEGGLVGYFNYDLIRTWAPLPDIGPKNGDLPEAVFMIPGKLIVFDHVKHEITVMVFALLRTYSRIKYTYEVTCRELFESMAELEPMEPASPEGTASNRIRISGLRSDFSRDAFESAVLRARESIAAGELIQVVLSRKHTGEVQGDHFLLYERLKEINPSPYMFYINFARTKLIGSSPEALVRLRGDRIQLWPIAGTRPRGVTGEADSSLANELLSDPKERAEHLMLVDLGRNDVGKVAKSGSVTVTKFMEVEYFSHVMHLVSRVEGRLKKDLDCFDLFRSVFPAGTVTGAPKVRAMELISELEPSARCEYAGAVGYFGFEGDMDFCITIRTIVITDNRLSIQTGAGIVHESSPGREYLETLKKAEALFKTIGVDTGV